MPSRVGAGGGLVFDARMPARGFDVQLRVRPGETIAVLGRNGAGKSTLLGLVAGLLVADEGEATLDGRTLFRSQGVFSPPHRRAVALLAQQALLFPHLSVLDNVAFGPRSSGLPRSASRAEASRWLAEVDALDLADRRPTQLSGGQAQRVAVARALAAAPDLLLLDEPLSALDVDVAPVLRRMLRRVLADRAAIIVTHDVLDAYSLADTVVVLDGGRVVEHGPTRDVLRHPRSPFTARLAGLAIFTGARTADGLLTASGLAVRGTPTVGAASLPVGAAVIAAVRPSDVHVSAAHRNRTSGSATVGVVSDLEPVGDLIRVRTDELAADVTPEVIADLDIAPGSMLAFTIAATGVDIYPA